jgi:threonine dehydratase
MAGQATVGVEILEQLPDVDAILVPIGGGGLISGIGSAIKWRRPGVKIIGVEPAGKPAAYNSFKAGHRVALAQVDTQADGLRGNVVGPLAWEVMQSVVDDLVLVSEESIVESIRRLMLDAKQVVEPAGVIGLAAVLSEAVDVTGKKVAVVLSGGNIDPDVLAAALDCSPEFRRPSVENGE